MEANSHAAQRRERRRASAFVNQASDDLRRSKSLAQKGRVAAADRVARLAERHAKLAERLIDLKAALRRITQARLDAERALDASFTEREAALKAREDKLYFAELALRQRVQGTPPLDPEAERWQERLARLHGET